MNFTRRHIIPMPFHKTIDGAALPAQYGFPYRFAFQWLALMLFLFVTMPAFAQAAEEPDPVSVKFRLFVWGQPHSAGQRVSQFDAEGNLLPSLRYEAPQIAYLDGSGAVRPLVAMARRLSNVYTYRGRNPLVLVNPQGGQEPIGNAGGVPLYTELGRVMLSAGAAEVILFLFPVRDAAQARYQILPIAIPDARDLHNKVLAVNFSPSAIAVKIGNTQRLLEPGIPDAVELGRRQDSQLPVAIATINGNGDWKLKASQMLSTPGDGSAIVVFYSVNDTYRAMLVPIR